MKTGAQLGSNTQCFLENQLITIIVLRNTKEPNTVDPFMVIKLYILYNN